MRFEKRTPELRLRLEGWRSRVVLGLVAAGFAVLAGRAFFLQGLNHGFLQQKGEARYGRVVEMPASRGPVKDRNGQPLAISTPVESIWASPEDFEADAAKLRALAAGAEPGPGRHPPESCQQGSPVRLAPAPDFARAGRQGDGAGRAGGLPAARVPPLLPGGRGDGARGRLHRHRRQRAGGHRARPAILARGHARKPQGDQGQEGTHRRGRGEPARAARRQGAAALDRPAPAVPRAPRAQGRGRGQPRPRRLAGDARRAHGRGPGAREPARLQPQQPRQRDRPADAQPLGDGHLRAGLDDEALHRRRGPARRGS